MESLTDINWVWVAIAVQGIIIVLAWLYFTRLRRAAQNALLYAFPRRKALSRTRLGQQALEFVTPEEASPEHLTGQVDLNTFQTVEMLPSPVVRGDLWTRGGKRGLDILVSLAVIVLTFPVMLVTAIAIKLDSLGPIFYRQQRVGRHGKLFDVIKFRSMTVNAESNGAVWAKEKDNRVTAIGAFIRKTRIDELPQTINILMGQMSFVGPRPERPEFTELLKNEIPHYDDRHQVKPGLTGWAQINYPYGASIYDAREKLTYDLYYMKYYSFMLDLFIIIRTLKVALKGIGAR